MAEGSHVDSAKEDGGFSWLKCDWPPMESDDHYGVTLAAIAVGVAPDDYVATPALNREHKSQNK